jgi:carboxylate-amine ligase
MFSWLSEKDHVFTLGIEESSRLSIRTRNCVPHQEILEGGKVVLKEQINPRCINRSSAGHGDCDSIEHARTLLISAASWRVGGQSWTENRVGRHIFLTGASAHHRGERYKQIIEDMQLLARANLIFGLHVHVGIPDREMAIHVMNQARYFCPIFTRCRSTRRFGSA